MIPYQCLVTFFNQIQKHEKRFATLEIQHTHKRINSINRGHKNNYHNGALLLWIFPVIKML
ncbi:hypothetical protein Hanom_Chr01g00046121 [Helianthus anomalus]